MKHLDPLQRGIICGAAADLDKLRKTPVPGGCGNGDLKLAIRNAVQGIVKCRPFDWLRGFDPDAPSVRMAVSRAYAKLEKRGLVERVACGFSDRTTHLRLTKNCIALAKQLSREGGGDD